jgi:flavin-dependent dehydrogenase
MADRDASLKALAGQHWDLAVVGAGCAGTMAALWAARGGLRVLLLEKARFPRYKVCGGCLNLRSVRTLEAAGLTDWLAEHGAPLRAFRLYAGRAATVPLPGGTAVARSGLDAALAHAAAAVGARVRFGATARLEGQDADGAWMTVRDGAERVRLRAARVVLAGGLAGAAPHGDDAPATTVAAGSRIGGGCELPAAASLAPNTIHMACGRQGYVGLVVLRDGRLNVAGAFDPAFVSASGGLGAAASRIVNEAGLDAGADVAAGDWKGTPPLTRRRDPVALGRVFLVGDAAGYVEPFTGEGMAWALRGGLELGTLLAGEGDDASGAWRRRCEGLREGQQLCRWMAAGLRRPWAVRGVAHVLRVAPALAAPVVGRLNRPGAPAGAPGG